MSDTATRLLTLLATLQRHGFVSAEARPGRGRRRRARSWPVVRPASAGGDRPRRTGRADTRGLHGLTAEELCDEILRTIEPDHDDDIALLAVRATTWPPRSTPAIS